MGKYNFSAQKWAEFEKRLESLEKANNDLRKENAELRKAAAPPRKKRILMSDMKNGESAKRLFCFKATADERVIKCPDEFNNNFNTFYQNLFRAMDPCAGTRIKGHNPALRYKPIMDLPEAEYDVYVEVLDEVVCTLSYGKAKLEKLREGKEALG